MGRIISEVDNIDSSSFFGVLKAAGKMVGMLLRIQSLFREAANGIVREIERAIPSKQEIADEMYEKLMSQINER